MFLYFMFYPFLNIEDVKSSCSTIFILAIDLHADKNQEMSCSKLDRKATLEQIEGYSLT